MRRALPGPKSTLQYQKKPAAILRWHRRAVPIAIALLTLFVLWRVTPLAWRNLRVLPLQRACMTYTADPAQPVATYPGGGSAPLANWEAFYALASGDNLQSAGTVFLHERTSEDGQRRLVAVDLLSYTMAASAEQYATLYPRVVIPGSAFVLPRPVVRSIPQEGLQLGKMRPLNPTSIFPGEADPADASHFTIRLVHGETTTIVDGWLRNDDRVLLQPRQPTWPASLPTTMESAQAPADR
jgi:hypothetical protein